MHTKKTKDKGEKEKSRGFNCGPVGHGMFKMMNTCCSGQGGFPDCATMMKGMEATRTQPCCTPKKDAAEFEGRKK